MEQALKFSSETITRQKKYTFWDECIYEIKKSLISVLFSLHLVLPRITSLYPS